MMRLAWAWLATLLALGFALAQTEPLEPLGTLTIRREDRTIQVLQYAPASEGGEFRLLAPNCQEGVRTSTVYAPEPYFVETLINDTRITSSIVIEHRPPEEQGGQEASTLEIFGGTLEVDPETLCPQNIERSEVPSVTIEEGRTTISGADFSYDNATGLGIMEGPIELVREAEGESPALNATADMLEFNADKDLTILQGNVQVTSEDRSSQAEVLEYDEEAGIAILRGDPAVSQQGENRVAGQVIVYYLDSNDVVVKEGISATLQYDEGEGAQETETGASEEAQ